MSKEFKLFLLALLAIVAIGRTISVATISFSRLVVC